MTSNATCHEKTASQDPPPLIQNGHIVIQAHHIGWIITGFFTLAATITSLWLVNKHLQWYTNKREQRYIVRILFMVPIYAIVSFASYLFWNHSTPLLLLRDCYESTVLTSFFYLLLTYLSPNADEQRAIFRKVGLSKENDREAVRRGEPVKKWMYPLHFVKSKPGDGLYFLQIMKWGVLQYCVIRPTTTLAAVILDYIGLYCDDSWSPGWGHVYITVIVSISVSIAMYCLIQLYIPISSRLAPQKPLLKLFAVKAVVFLTFWQATLLSVLSTFGVVKDTQYMTADDINIGIGAILETVEMTIFAFLHIKAFSYKPYCAKEGRSSHVYGLYRTPRLRALGHAFDFRETFSELWTGCVFIVRRWRGIETDSRARRLIVREELFSTANGLGAKCRNGARDREKGRLPLEYTYEDDCTVNEKKGGMRVAVDVEKEFHVDKERQWLGTGNDYIYGLGYARRERSAGLAEQIDDELERRGLSTLGKYHNADLNGLVDSDLRRNERRQRSWWHAVYDRLSRASQGEEIDQHEQRNCNIASTTPRQIRRRSDQPASRTGVDVKYNSIPVNEDVYDDPPPSSSLQKHRISRTSHIRCGADSTPASSALLPTAVYPPTNQRSRIQSGRGDHDIVLSRIFPHAPANGRSEVSRPSSTTHPSSRGNHVRLTAPAPAVPTRDWRAPVEAPVLVDVADLGQNVEAVAVLSSGQKGRTREKRETRMAKVEHQDTRDRYITTQRAFTDEEAASRKLVRDDESMDRSQRRHRRERARHDSVSSSVSPPPTLKKFRPPDRSMTDVLNSHAPYRPPTVRDTAIYGSSAERRPR